MPAPDRDRDQEKVDRLVEGIRAQRRAAVSQAITLVESSRPQHRAQARALLTELAEESGGSEVVRVGISGVPGVGKSTFIEALGTRLVAEGHKVGVLAVDPSSVRTGGSVLGDKTRMGRLSVEPDAFIRPSPSAGTLGGVARATVQAMGVLEAAGYDVILVETVGVGQSEVTVAGMVDTFLFLTLARTGDQLQGIKKGILEHADIIAVNKADGERVELAKARQIDLERELTVRESTITDLRGQVAIIEAKVREILEKGQDILEKGQDEALQLANRIADLVDRQQEAEARIHELAPVAWNVVINTMRDRLEQRRLAVIPAANDRGDTSWNPHPLDRSGVGQREVHAQLWRRHEGDDASALHRPIIVASRARERRAVDHERDETSRIELLAQPDRILEHLQMS